MGAGAQELGVSVGQATQDKAQTALCETEGNWACAKEGRKFREARGRVGRDSWKVAVRLRPVTKGLYQSARAALTKYYRLVNLNQRNLFSHSSGG